MRHLTRLALAFFLVLGGVSAALAAEPALGGATAEDVVTIVTRNEDGSARETKIWIVDVDGKPYVRTGGTRWYHNIERNPDVTLKASGQDLALHAKAVDDEALRAKIEAAFAEKYGFTDRLRGWFVWGRPNLMELERR